MSGFTLNLTGVQCYGMSSTASGNASPSACEQACCTDATCTIWQFDAGNADGACWTGADCSDNTTNPAWTSYARPTPGPTPPPVAVCSDAGQPCSVPFPDTAWRTVNTPHDFIVEGTPNPNADRGHGYLPFNVSWCVLRVRRALARGDGALCAEHNAPSGAGGAVRTRAAASQHQVYAAE